MTNDECKKSMNNVSAALTNPKLTVGHKVAIGEFIHEGNMPHDAPALSPMFVDDLGRFWAERHHGDQHELVCVGDPQALFRTKAA